MMISRLGNSFQNVLSEYILIETGTQHLGQLPKNFWKIVLENAGSHVLRTSYKLGRKDKWSIRNMGQ